jgi:YidC/Oxa1 family membrane protein insertase
MWSAIQEFLGTIVSFFYGLIPNLGVAIILLTVAVGVVLFPLTLKQTRSMKAMQDLQPDIKRLQKELGHDKPALQQATMALYKERKVNPAAGCLPLLLQMPIWLALYQVLRTFAGDTPWRWVIADSRLATDMHAGGTAWLDFLWMRLDTTPREAIDLGFRHSIAYLITIAVVMATAYYQQAQMMRRSKQSQQEQQKIPGQAIMKIFPVMFGFISFTLPAGLVVYFAASQIFRIGQQSLILWLGDRHDRERAEGVIEKVEPVEAPKPTKPLPPTGSAPRLGAATGGDKGTASARDPQASKKRGKKRKRR